MKIIFLGTNGWYSSPTGDTACVLIDSKDHYVVFDAGNGIYKLDQYITEDKPISLFISHFHLDHTSGLHTLAKFNFRQGIDVYVGQGRTDDFHTLVNPPFTIGYQPQAENIKNLKTEIRLHDLTEKEEKIPFKARAYALHHAYVNHGYRIKLEEKIISYTGDCGFTENLNKLTKDADVLISECAIKGEPQNKTLWGHINHLQAAQLAKKQNVKKLLLTHFGPADFPALIDRHEAEAEARKIFPDTTAALDGLEIEI